MDHRCLHSFLTLSSSKNLCSAAPLSSCFVYTVPLQARKHTATLCSLSYQLSSHPPRSLFTPLHPPSHSSLSRSLVLFLLVIVVVLNSLFLAHSLDSLILARSPSSRNHPAPPHSSHTRFNERERKGTREQDKRGQREEREETRRKRIEMGGKGTFWERSHGTHGLPPPPALSPSVPETRKPGNQITRNHSG